MTLPFLDFDANATTPLRPEARAAMLAALDQGGNASSIHWRGRAARQSIEAARDRVAAAVGVPPGGGLVFTSGATEANHLALAQATGRRLLVSAIEHDSLRVPAEAMGAAVLPVGGDGVVDLVALDRWLAAGSGPALISVMVANNETGVIQPLAAIVAQARGAGALVHADAAQAIGKIPFDMAALDLDAISLSGHKFGGPTGVGVFAYGPRLVPRALQTGGGQERGLRAGTENLAGILGLAAAIAPALADLAHAPGIATRRDRLEQAMLAAVPRAIGFGAAAPRLPNTLVVALPGVPAATQVMALDLAGIGVSAGAACSSGKIRPSPVLTAMGVDPALAGEAIRISLGRDSDEAACDRLLAAWVDLARRTGESRARAGARG